MRALAQLGVIHKPDFASQEDADLVEQLSRREDSVKVLERHGFSLTLSLMKPGVAAEMDSATVTAGRNDPAVGRDVLRKVIEIVEARG